MPKKDKKVGSNFFKKLRLKRVNMKYFEGIDRPGFKLEDNINGYRVYTLRQESDKDNPGYPTTVFNGPEPRDILVQTKNSTFKEAIRTHYSALKDLAEIRR